MTRPTINKMTYLLFEVNHAIDKGSARVGLEEMRNVVESQRLFEFFEAHGETFDVSILDDDVRAFLSRNLSEIAGGFHSREAAKVGIQNDGLCLLVAYLTELIQTNTSRYHAVVDLAEPFPSI